LRIHVKLLILSFALVFALVALTGVLFYGYNERSALQKATNELYTVGEKLSLQVESRIQQIDVALLFVLSDPDFLSALSTYTMPGRDAERNRLILADSASTINRLFKSYAVDKHFHQIVLFDEVGDYFSSNFRVQTPSPARVIEMSRDIAWTGEAAKLQGKLLLVGPYRDSWSGQAQRVYGAARALKTVSGVTCYIEVQRAQAELDELLALGGFEGVGVELMDEGGVFYAPEGQADAPEGAIVVTSEKNRYGLYARLTLDSAAVRGDLAPGALQIALICLMALAGSFFYIYFATRRLMRPLRTLQEAMDLTALDNLGGRLAPHSVDELKSLNDAFAGLCERLGGAVDEKMRAQRLELEARLDALQAQIDPHFLYNTLNVIMNRAMQIGDEEILSICEGIASMLRYSTGTERRLATLGEEKAHLETYLLLMKKRFRHRLHYAVDIPEEMLELRLPKMMLQPLAENAIQHGFAHKGGQMRVDVRAWTDGEYWRVEVSDNGEGFGEEVLKDLQEKLAAVREGVFRPGAEGLSIGGMGLINTYARLHFHFGHACKMTIHNGATGARVEIRAPLRGEASA
jgi:two-component system sensor histidine kinase YesM